MKRDTIFKNINYNIISVIFQNLSYLLSITIVTRIITPEDYGKVNSYISLIAIFAPLILNGASTFFMRLYKESGKIKLENYFRYTFIVSLILMILLSILLFNYNGYGISNKIEILYLFIFFIGISLDLTWIFRGIEVTKPIAISNFVSFILNLIFLVMLMPFINKEVFLLYYASSRFIVSLILLLVYKKFIATLTIEKYTPFSNNSIQSILFLGLSGVLNVIYVRSDVVLLNYYKFYYEVGLYSAAYTIINIIFVLRGNFLSAITPSLMNTYKYSSVKEYKNILLSYARIGSIIGMNVLAMLLIWGELILGMLFGPIYREAYYVLVLLGIMLYVVFANLGISSSIIVFKKDKFFMYMTIVAALINIAFNMIFIPKFHMYATSLTTIVAELIILILAAIIIDQEAKGFFFKFFIINIKTIILYGIIILISIYLFDSIIGRLIIYIILQLVIILVFKLLIKKDISLLIK